MTKSSPAPISYPNGNRGLISAAVAGLYLTSLTIASVANAYADNPPSAGHTEKRVVIGDVVITGFSSSRAAQGERGFTILGPGVRVVAPDPESHSIVELVADTVNGTPFEKDPVGKIDVQGHVHFHVTRQAAQASKSHSKLVQPSTLDGSAGHITYVRATGVITLTQGVRATVTERLSLARPARITADTAEADLKTEPATLILRGAERRNTLVVAPANAVNAGSTKQSSAPRAYNFSMFSEARFQPGHIGEFTGPGVIVESDRDAAGNRVWMRSSHLLSDYDNAVLQTIRTGASVEFRAEQTILGKQVQSAAGSANTAVYHTDTQLLDLSGSSKTRFENQEKLVGPGVFESDSVELNLNASPYKLTASGDRTTNVIEFSLKQLSPDGTVSSLPVRIEGYKSIPELTAKSATFTGPDTTATIGSPTNSASRSLVIHSDQLKLEFRTFDHQVQRVIASGKVRYRLYRPPHTPKLQDPLSLKGTADRIDYHPQLGAITGNPKAPVQNQELQLIHFQCSVDAPNRLTSPGMAVAESGTYSEAKDGQPHITLGGRVDTTKIVAPLAVPGGTRTIELTRFTYAEFAPGKSFWAKGDRLIGLITEIATLGAQQTIHLQELNCAQVAGSIDSSSGLVADTAAEGNVHLADISTVTSTGKKPLKRSMTSSSDRVHFLAAKQLTELTGHVACTLTDSERLASPATMSGSYISISTGQPFQDLTILSPALERVDGSLHLSLLPSQAPATPNTRTMKAKKPAENDQIAIDHFDSFKMEPGFRFSTKGANSVVDYIHGGNHVRIAASEVTAFLKADQSDLDSADAHGNVHYDITGLNAQGSISNVVGVSQGMHFDRDSSHLQLTDAVSATIADKENLAEPALITGANVDITAELSQTIVAISGAPASFDCKLIGKQLTRKNNIKAESTAPGAPPITHLAGAGFQFALMQTGSGARLTGPGSRLVVDESVRGSHTEILAPTISAYLDDTQSTTTLARAEGGVHFLYTSPIVEPVGEHTLPAGPALVQTCTGTALQLSMVSAVSNDFKDSMDASGPMDVTLTNSVRLLEPARIVGRAGQTLHVDLGSDQRISWNAAGGQMTVQVRPRPAEARKRDAEHGVK